MPIFPYNFPGVFLSIHFPSSLKLYWRRIVLIFCLQRFLYIFVSCSLALAFLIKSQHIKFLVENKFPVNIL